MTRIPKLYRAPAGMAVGIAAVVLGLIFTDHGWHFLAVFVALLGGYVVGYGDMYRETCRRDHAEALKDRGRS
jgi:hypothetical protein